MSQKLNLSQLQEPDKNDDENEKFYLNRITDDDPFGLKSILSEKI